MLSRLYHHIAIILQTVSCVGVA